MEIKAEQKIARISPRKVSPVARGIKGLSPEEALVKLRFIRKKGAVLLAKVIKQAIANAKIDKDLKKDNLKFKYIIVGKGPILKRWRPRARGKADRIDKRTCHIRVILETNSKNLKAKGYNLKGKAA